ncbi:response regulator [Halovenus marina]|uniref:response regulator n=1 Tax=Halovenus marina TaxID=3396621 RepID=UPI003F5497A8
MGDSTPLPNALVVDDEKEVADAYALRLRGLCEIETVYDGRTALEETEQRAVDIVLLDRHMPGLSGDEVLEKLDDRDYYGQVIMVTAIDPGFDVLDMPFDDYLCKPIDREDVREAVTQQCTVLGYETLGEYFRVESTRRVIAAEVATEDRETHDEYQETIARASELEERVRRLLDDAETLLDQFEDIGREGQ